MQSKKLLTLSSVIILAGLLLAGCGGGSTRGPVGGSEGDGTGLPGGYIEIKGSDTMVNLGQALAEIYMDEVNPNAMLSVTGGGSGTGIASMINDDVDIAQSSRAMKKEELDNAAANGVTAYEFIVAQDGLAVAVNAANPIENLTIAQARDIFTGKITDWSELGWTEGGKITIYSRQSNSGTYVFFNENVMDGEDWAPGTMFMPGSSTIAEGLTSDRNGIGYFGVGYVKAGVKAINVAAQEGGEYITPLEKANVDSGKYPISRPLFFYTNGLDNQLVLHYLEWVLSPEGQEAVAAAGFYGLTADQVKVNDGLFSKIGVK